MVMLSSFRGDKHEFCLVVIRFKHVRSCPSIFAIFKTDSCNFETGHGFHPRKNIG